MTNLKWGYNKLTEEQKNEIWSRFQGRESVEVFIENLELFYNQMLTSNGKVRPKGQMELEQLIVARVEMETIISEVSGNNQSSFFTEIEIQKINRFLEMSNLGARGRMKAAAMNNPEVSISRSMLDYDRTPQEEKDVPELIKYRKSPSLSFDRYEQVLAKKDRLIIRYQQERENLFKEIDDLRERVYILEQMLAEKNSNNS